METLASKLVCRRGGKRPGARRKKLADEGIDVCEADFLCWNEVKV